MVYLESKGVVHRDLAARNVLGKSFSDNNVFLTFSTFCLICTLYLLYLLYIIFIIYYLYYIIHFYCLLC